MEEIDVEAQTLVALATKKKATDMGLPLTTTTKILRAAIAKDHQQKPVADSKKMRLSEPATVDFNRNISNFAECMATLSKSMSVHRTTNSRGKRTGNTVMPEDVAKAFKYPDQCMSVFITEDTVKKLKPKKSD